ncbi:hypothetical protein BBOV_III007235 [Babesia bovis T2Bo]|uniref:hypothetical protein n=1 Tax=Babesia bovis T2Bo TaxID=484906 RepID=UPI001C352C81|nr:hypothetical protein BBOV_III007235 [Babesia bovis T2Bo]KAG6440077.1 hypothetical protein BBOV_III007235 [Babesia bovis T2Bo]
MHWLYSSIRIFVALSWLFARHRTVAEEQPLEELSQEDDLSDLPECKTVLAADSAALTYCLNGSTCRVGKGSGKYAQIVCDCSTIATKDVFYAGPKCATKVRRKYRVQQAFNFDSTLQVINTCLIEDVLGMNQWKNDVTSVGHLPI